MGRRAPEHNAAIGDALRARGVGKSPTKTCPQCRLELPRATAYRTRPNGFTRSWCLKCEAAQQARVRGGRPPNPREQRQNRAAQFKRKYGLTLDEYEEMLASQSGGCAICRRTDPGTINRKFLYVDHVHSTGEVRGILCARCNTGIGMFLDDPTLLLAAVSYLDKAAER
jgi:hypothetical protein